MSKRNSFRTLSLFITFIMLLGVVLLPTSAQTGTQPQQATEAPPGTDDADDLPIYMNIVGYVQALTQTSLTVNGMTILIPAGISLPSQIGVGKVVSLRGNLRDDDRVTLIFIVIGYHLPTPTPIPPATPVATTVATQQPTLQATEDNTVPPTLPAAADCGKARQSLAVMISAGYRVTYNEVIRLHCKGYSFGMIARSYLLVFSGRDAGKDLSVDTILVLRLKHRRWRVIILLLDVHPDTSLLILVFDGGRAAVLFNCGSGVTFKHAAICVGISTGGGGGGASAGDNENNGKGKGHKGDDQGEDDD